MKIHISLLLLLACMMQQYSYNMEEDFSDDNYSDSSDIAAMEQIWENLPLNFLLPILPHLKPLEQRSTVDEAWRTVSPFPVLKTKYFEALCDPACYISEDDDEIRRNIAAALCVDVSPNHPFMHHYFVHFIQKSDYDLIKLMLYKKVNPCCKAGPSHALCSAQTVQMAQLLVDQGADCNATNECGNLIHNTLMNSFEPRLIGYYAATGVSFEHRNKDGLTPLDYFCRKSMYTSKLTKKYIKAFLNAGITEEQIADGFGPLPETWQEVEPRDWR